MWAGVQQSFKQDDSDAKDIIYLQLWYLYIILSNHKENNILYEMDCILISQEAKIHFSRSRHLLNFREYISFSSMNNCSASKMYYWSPVQFGVRVRIQGKMVQRLCSLSITSMLFTWLYKRLYHIQSEGKYGQQPFVSMIGHL